MEGKYRQKSMFLLHSLQKGPFFDGLRGRGGFQPR